MTVVAFATEWAAHLVEMGGLLVATSFALGLVRHDLGLGWVRVGLARHDRVGLVAGALLGVVTPVCSCSVGAVYASLLHHGASTRAAAAFLFAAPAVNEIVLVAVVLTAGWQGAVLYLGAGLAAAVLTGHFARELHLQPCAHCTRHAAALLSSGEGALVKRAAVDTLVLVRTVAPALAVGAGLAAGLAVWQLDVTGPVLAAREWTLAPVAAAAVGLPLHVEPALVAGMLVPLAEVGLEPGTLLSLTMAVTVASVPEGALLRRLVGWRGLGTLTLWYFAYVSTLGLIVNALWSQS